MPGVAPDHAAPRPVVVSPAVPRAPLSPLVPPVAAALPVLPIPPIVAPPRPRRISFRVEGVVGTPLGDAPVAVRSSEPFHVYASHIERVVVRGSGTVTGFSWLPAENVTRLEPLRLNPLPTTSGARYSGPADGRDRGFERVEKGAPQRRGMHEDATAASPGACPTATPPEEVDRVLNLVVTAETTLDRLINDTSAPQQQLLDTETVRDENGNPLGTSSRPALLDLLQGAVDPGFARWLGFLDVDDSQFQSSEVIAYVVDALFLPDAKALARAGLQGTLGPESQTEDGVKALLGIAGFPELEKYAGGVKAMGRGPFLVGRVVLALTVGAPLDQPGIPGVASITSGDWLPATAPTANRELTASLASLLPGAGLASAIGQPAGAPLAERNPKDTIGRLLLLTARPDPVALSATAGILADRTVDERDGSWRLAQSDWFGRWSNPALAPFGPASRPRPPRPTLTLTTRPPTVPAPTPLGPMAGTVRIEVSVPPVAGLPSGGRLLASLRLTVTRSDSGAALTVHPVPTPSAPPEVVVIEVPGPALAPTQVGTTTVTAVWSDSAGVDSDPSEPKVATLHDPRPPTAVVIPPTLTYTARPDATGRARATLEWSPGAGQSAYRVFVADETTMRAKLAEVAAGQLADGDAGQAPSATQAQGVLTALDAAGDDAPARGAVWNAQRALLPRRWWRQLTGEPMPRPVSGPARYTHDLSGSLTVLALFRVVAVSAASVESDFASSPLMPRAVPNLLVPPQPSIRVMPVVDGSGNLQAQVHVTVAAGPTPAARYRLRRASATTDPMLMTIAQEGVVPPRPPGPAAPQVFIVTDDGSTPTAERSSLAGWVQYSWRVELQGAAAPGGGPVGEWSSPSAAAETMIMPPDPPQPVTDLAADRDAAGVHLRFRHPDPLAPGGSSGYVVDVYRQLSGQALRLLTSVPGQAPPPTGRGANVAGSFDVVDGDAEAVAGTMYRVVVTDPIGRASAPSDPVVAP